MSLTEELEKLHDLYTRGALSADEFSRAKSALLTQPQQTITRPDALVTHLDEVQFQNELARIDREWEMERENYVIQSRYGRSHVPTGSDVTGAVFGAVFGIIWTIVAFTVTSYAPDVGPFPLVKICFPLFGVVIVIFALVHAARSYSRMQDYEEARRAYEVRRQNVRKS
jgi:hypothetical protein